MCSSPQSKGSTPAPVVVGSPAAMLVTADFFVQTSSWKVLSVNSFQSTAEETNHRKRKARTLNALSLRRLKSALECGSLCSSFSHPFAPLPISKPRQMLGMEHGAGRRLLRLIGRYGTVLSAAEKRLTKLWSSPTFCTWNRDWQLLECVHHAHSGRAVYSLARLALSAMRKAHQAIRQRASLRMVLAARKMQELRAAHFSDVPAGRTRYRTFVRRLLFGIWNYASHGEVAVLCLPDHHFDGNGPARAVASRPHHLARICSWARVLRRRAAQ